MTECERGSVVDNRSGRVCLIYSSAADSNKLVRGGPPRTGSCTIEIEVDFKVTPEAGTLTVFDGLDLCSPRHTG